MTAAIQKTSPALALAEDRVKLRPQDLKRMNLPEEFWRARLEEVTAGIRPVLQRYLASFEDMGKQGVGLVFAGQAGTGKTGAAAVLLKALRSIRKAGYFTSVWDLREAIRNRETFDAEVTVLERCRDVEVLVLDNLREEDYAEKFFGKRDIEELLASRCSRGRISFVTTRQEAKQIAGNGGFFASNAHRLVLVEVRGPDRRKAQAAALQQKLLGTK